MIGAGTGLGMSSTDSSDQTIYSVLNGTKKISEVVKKTNFENLDLISSIVRPLQIPRSTSKRSLSKIGSNVSVRFFNNSFAVSEAL